MIVLLLDSSEKNLSVGLAKDGVLFASKEYEAWQRQSEFMIAEIHDMIATNLSSPKDLEAVVAAKGPGSYTGIRIALTIAKTISFALSVPLYLCSSLEAMKAKEGTSVCLMNARSKRSYLGVYDKTGALEEDVIKDNADVLSYLKEHPEYKVCGDVGYLGLESASFSRLENLASFVDEKHRCLEPLGARPVYLKDDYSEGGFKTVIRKTLPSDLKTLAELEKRIFKHPYTENQLLYELTENPVAHLYSAVVDGEVIGFIDFYITFDSSSIVQIGVKEEFRKKGVGNLLLGQMLKDLASQEEPVSFITLEVRASNEPAKKFYKKHRFEEITVKRAYYEDGEDAIYMVRSL